MTADQHVPLLEALAESDNRVTRRRLLDRLTQAPVDLSSLIVARLSDSRWYVQRNMLLLLERTERVPAGFSAAPWMMHDDWRVRYEAVRLALTQPAERDAAVRAALSERQPRIIALALSALSGECPPVLVDQVAALATDQTLPDDTRLLALRVLEGASPSEVLTTFTSLVDGGRTLLGRARLAPPTPVMLAALAVLARHFADDPTAIRFLKLAGASSQPGVRAAIEGSTS